MSVKQIGKVWELVLPPAHQLVLLAYADHADHDGGRVFPSTALIAWKTGYSTRQVRRITQQLVASGLMEVVNARAGKTTLYRLTLENGTTKAPFAGRERAATPDKMSYDKMSPLTPQGKKKTPTPDMPVRKTARNRHIEPSKEEARSRRPARIDNATFDALWGAYVAGCVENGLPVPTLGARELRCVEAWAAAGHTADEIGRLLRRKRDTAATYQIHYLSEDLADQRRRDLLTPREADPLFGLRFVTADTTFDVGGGS